MKSLRAKRLLAFVVAAAVGMADAPQAFAETTKGEHTLACQSVPYLLELYDALKKDVERGGDRTTPMLKGPCGSIKPGIYAEVVRTIQLEGQPPIVEVRFWTQNSRIEKAFYLYKFQLDD